MVEVWCQCYSFPAGSKKPQLLCLMPEVSYELFPAWLQVSSLLWEKLWSFAKIIENDSTLHFLLNNNIPMFVLLSFILFCLQLMVVWWSSDWTKKFTLQKSFIIIHMSSFPPQIPFCHFTKMWTQIFPQLWGLNQSANSDLTILSRK